MCGICGIIHKDLSKPIDQKIIRAMSDSLQHRGPDTEGFHIEEGVGLAVKRLAIIDVQNGNQPVYNNDKSIIAIVNGEIYNHKDLRNKLSGKGISFRSNSDAEVVPHLYEKHGIDFASHLNGMFAIAIWDARERQLILARDRMGQKPLYYTTINNSLIFGSELKALIVHPDFKRDIDREALSKYLAYEYIPSPKTIFKNTSKLEAGTYLIFKNGTITIKKYWDIPIKDFNSYKGSFNDAKAELLELLANSVKRRLMSDVPLGIFLSGGVDSSSITALMSKYTDPERINTFTIGFHEKSFDESSYARLVASKYKTNHKEKYCTPGTMLDVVPKIVDFLDEPLGDASIIPTYLLSQFTKEHVTVALSGDGGDELFAGYPTFQAAKLIKYYELLPKSMRKNFLEPLINKLPVSTDNFSFDFKLKRFINSSNIIMPHRHFAWMGSFNKFDQASLLIDNSFNDHIYEDVDRYITDSQTDNTDLQALYLYKKLYLQNDLLTKVDRASMACSLEARAPFLDHELVEFVSKLPYEWKIKGLTTKYILKEAMRPYLPKTIIKRSKKGFGIPVAKWLKGPLKELTLDLLAPDKLKREGLFNVDYVQKLIDEHYRGSVDRRKKLWTLLIFEMWLSKWM